MNSSFSYDTATADDTMTAASDAATGADTADTATMMTTDPPADVMTVIKRNGTKQAVNFNKITRRLKQLAWGLEPLDLNRVTQIVIRDMSQSMPTSRIDALATTTCMSFALEKPDYGTLGARIFISNWHKQTPGDPVAAWDKIHDCGLLNREFVDFYRDNQHDLRSMVNYHRDYDFDYFALATLKKLYCVKLDGESVERPQDMWLRVACVVSGYDLERVRETYESLSSLEYIHGSPTLFNAGMKAQQLASCYLQTMGDSIESIYDTLKKTALISKNGGGIGLSIGSVRSKGMPIRGTNGTTDGLVKMLRVFNETVCYVDQSSRRKGAMATFLDVTHPDLYDWLALKLPGGEEQARCRDLFFALWIPDIFMDRVQSGGDWTFMDPDVCPDLQDAYGDDFTATYLEYERQGKGIRTVPAVEVWRRILDSQMQTGMPYMSYKDHINRKSNQQNVGTIRNSNLCNEIVQYCSEDEVSVCTLASVSLPACIRDGEFDFTTLMRITRLACRNLDTCIDQNMYPIPEAERSNQRHRPIGLGCQGLCDALIDMGIPFDCDEAVDMSRKIAAVMYWAALDTSADLARHHGAYSTFQGSPASRGQLQPHLWHMEPHPSMPWQELQEKINVYGLRNSLSIAIMPTASSASVLMNTESTELVTSFVYVRRTLAGEHTCIYRRLIDTLRARGLWTHDIRQQILANDGSIQGIQAIPQDVQDLFKTAYDIKQKWVVDHALARGAYVCQSQSMNIFMREPSYQRLTNLHMYAWRHGLKNSLYYLRMPAVSRAQQIAIEAPSCLNCSG
jgi:ribonucleoside-diphosphate reductase alpha subunit